MYKDLYNEIAQYLLYKDFHIMCQLNKEINLQFNKYKHLKQLLIKKINKLNGYNKDDDFASDLIEIINNNTELSLGGPIIINSINNDKCTHHQDTDIYCQTSYVYMFKIQPYQLLEEFLQKNGYKYNCSYFNCDHYSTVKNYYIRTFTNKEYSKINIIQTNYSPLDRINVIKDLTFLNNFYHSKKFYLSDIDSILNKTGFFENYNNIENILDDTMSNYLFGRLYWRFDRFRDLGYKIVVSSYALSKLCLHNTAYTMVKEENAIKIYQNRRQPNELVNFNTSIKYNEYFLFTPNPFKNNCHSPGNF